MRTFVRRLALLAALGACVAATVSVSADALPIPEAGAKTGGIARSLAYVQPLNEQESGIALNFGCDFEYGGSVTGSPISNGSFFGILLVNCSAPGPCYEAGGFTQLSDDAGEIDKEQSGQLCVIDSGPGGFTLRFDGRYTIGNGAGRYAAAQGTGTMSMTFTCGISGFCGASGTETSEQPEEGPIKKGNDPEHVLLCSPVLVPRADGTIGNALQVPYADYVAWLADPTTHPEIPNGSEPAKYGQDIGLTCDNLPGYANSGKFADETGALPEPGTTNEGAIYPYWVKA